MPWEELRQLAATDPSVLDELCTVEFWDARRELTTREPDLDLTDTPRDLAPVDWDGRYECGHGNFETPCSFCFPERPAFWEGGEG